MEDSLKGIIVSATIIALFITAILNFVVMFPQEQGVTFNSASDANAYLAISRLASNSSTDTTSQLTDINNVSTTGFDQWDTTQGFMGSNTIKQTAATGSSEISGNIFTNLILIAKLIFGSGSPVLYALSVLALLTSVYLIYATIKFVRTGL